MSYIIKYNTVLIGNLLVICFSPDCNPLDFSVWDRLAAAIGAKQSKNRQDLVGKVEGTWHQVLDPEYVVKICKGVWPRLRHVVAVNGGYLTPEDNSNGT